VGDGSIRGRAHRLALRVTLVAAAGASLALPAAALGGSLFLIDGGGWGNGVGLSQWGAEGYARHGWDYRRILAHYYPGTTLATVKPGAVRVLLAGGRPRVAVGSTAPFALVDARGRRVHVPARELRFTAQLRLGRRALVPPVSIVAGAQPLTLDGRAYRGSLVLERAGTTLSAINIVPLERYLRGVVPSEMPEHWHAQAYQAQAVAARSYALACLNPGASFDLYADARDQVYGGIAAEQPQTNGAVGTTAGRVLTYGGHVITAYYGSSSGGRTAAVQDVLPTRAAEPYLVPVRDPFDSIAPLHRWRVTASSESLSRHFRLPVSDVRLEHNGSGRVSRALLVGGHGQKALSGRELAHALGLRSTLFSIRVVSLEPAPAHATYAEPVLLQGFVRGIGGVVVQERQPNDGWRQVRRVVAHPDGRFEAVVRPRFTTTYRLAVDGVAGPSVQIEVVRRIAVHADGTTLAGHVVPAAPVRVERLTGSGWRAVAGVRVGPSGAFRVALRRGGSYRVSSAGSTRFLASASAPVSVKR
jgi:stage II sporulation protein D